ncbi:DUF502 domain-containing protein [Halorarius halobius]|uniref:DUF502 domain-containing protein n=1 Tax=Halorarius halobius TaxID=2962671 RepID=UPI0020CC83F5|nr:DUF502 domain-containing protein [Halorarius halobius]
MLPSSWKRDFASGLVVLVPILVTAFVVAYVYTAILSIGILSDVFPQGTKGYTIVLVTLVIFVLVVLSIGYLMRTTLGDLMEAGLDSLFNRLPGLRIVYNASKMAAETALSGTDDLQAPVKLETWNGMRMTAFKTGKSTRDGRDVLFLPTAPNITTGFVIEVDPGEYEETDESVEDALTRILSAGFGESRDQSIPIDITEEDGVVASDGSGDD